MSASALIPIEAFSVLGTPKGSRWVAALVIKGYFDESGDSKDAKETSVCVGGYIAPLVAWRGFEHLWDAALKEFGIGYFHAQELQGRYLEFSEWTKGDPEVEKKVAALLGKLAEAIAVLRPFYGKGLSHVVIMEDLRRFNREHRLNIDAKALALYCTLMIAPYQFADVQVELVFDRMTKPEVVIAEAMHYFRTDPKRDLIKHDPIMVPLPEKGDASSKTVLPLQAADLFAWESRKWFELRRGFFIETPLEHQSHKTAAFWHINERLKDMKRRGLKSLFIPYHMSRRSIVALFNAVNSHGQILRYKELMTMHENRKGVW